MPTDNDFKEYIKDNCSTELLKEFETHSKAFEKESKIDKLLSLVKKLLPEESDTNKNKGVVEVKKTLDEEQRLALFVVLAPEEEDLHGDIYSEKEIEKACNNFNLACNTLNLFHKIETEKATIAQSFVNLCEFETEDGEVIKKGSWLQWIHFPDGDDESQELWDLVKSGEINGLSVGCTAICEEIEEND